MHILSTTTNSLTQSHTSISIILIYLFVIIIYDYYSFSVVFTLLLWPPPRSRLPFLAQFCLLLIIY